jgi:hypothetical protein
MIKCRFATCLQPVNNQVGTAGAVPVGIAPGIDAFYQPFSCPWYGLNLQFLILVLHLGKFDRFQIERQLELGRTQRKYQLPPLFPLAPTFFLFTSKSNNNSLLLNSNSPFPLTFALSRSAASLAGANAARAFPAAAAFCSGVASGSNA